MKGIVILALLVSLGAAFAPAQTRTNDKDILAMMNNLKSDAKKFQSAFNSSVGKSQIRKTSREKDSKTLVKNFQNQIQAMTSNFKTHRKADVELPIVVSSSNQIDQLMRDVAFDDRTNTAWTRVKSEVTQLSDAYGLPASTQPQ